MSVWEEVYFCPSKVPMSICSAVNFSMSISRWNQLFALPLIWWEAGGGSVSAYCLGKLAPKAFMLGNKNTRAKLSVGIWWRSAAHCASSHGSTAQQTPRLLLNGADPIAVSALRVTSGAVRPYVWLTDCFTVHRQPENPIPISQLTHRTFIGICALPQLGQVISDSVLVLGLWQTPIVVLSRTLAPGRVPVLYTTGIVDYHGKGQQKIWRWAWGAIFK